MSAHTVEKIGGTSMSRFGELMNNIIIGQNKNKALNNRIFVVSAYGGITDLLLEFKKSDDKGVYAYFAEGNPAWEQALDKVKEVMCGKNKEMQAHGLDLELANQVISQRIEETRTCLKDLSKLGSYGHFHVSEFLPAVREMLASMGEFHSAWNSVNALNAQGIKTELADLSGWGDKENLCFSEKIKDSFASIDFNECLVFATGYVKCSEGLMETYDRGYSEITFSKIACITQAREGIIHKEFHLSSCDPKLVGLEKVRTIGNTNFDVADQLSDLGMEAIHPGASKEMEQLNIPIRVANAFDPEHPGTLITADFKSKTPRVEMVTGRTDIIAIEIHDPDMVGQTGYDFRVLKYLNELDISYISKATNANTITHFIAKKAGDLDALTALLKDKFPGANIRTKEVAIVSAIGSNMKIPGFLAKSATELMNAEVNILAMSQCMRQVNMQFFVEISDFENAIKALHKSLVEDEPEA